MIATLLPFALLAAALVETAPPALRAPDAVLADFTRALGDAAAWKRHKTVHIKTTVVVKGMQINGSGETFATSTGKFLTVTSIPGMATFREGSTGKIRWGEDPIYGIRVLDGAEDLDARIEMTWNADMKLKQLFPKIRSVVPPPSANQKFAKLAKLECLELTAAPANPVTMCFHPQTHLRAFQAGVHSSPQGDVPYTSTFGDWRTTGGIKMAFVQEMTAGPMTLEMRTVGVTFDEPISENLFKMPKPGTAPHKP